MSSILRFIRIIVLGLVLLILSAGYKILGLKKNADDQDKYDKARLFGQPDIAQAESDGGDSADTADTGDAS